MPRRRLGDQTRQGVDFIDAHFRDISLPSDALKTFGGDATTTHQFERAHNELQSERKMLTIDPNLPRLPPREPAGHKGDYGRVLIVAGSRGMSGAAILAGLGALRGGAGLVRVACPAEIAGIVAGYEPSYLTLPLPTDEAGCIALAALGAIVRRPCDVLAFGPGLGQALGPARLLAALIEQIAVPLIIDADGLNLLVDQKHLLAKRPAPTILTPHPGEFSRLTGLSTSEIQVNRTMHAARFAAEHNVILLLKGAGTVITDGRQTAINPTGNPGMATGGTGDVLTGIIAALVAQKMSPFDAARLGAYVHGLAGDLVTESGSSVSLIATDLVAMLPKAFRMVGERKQD